MKQVWNIFRKDFCHHWPSVAASAAVLVAFAWSEVRGWSHDDAMASALSWILASRFLPGLVVALVPISWIFLIARVVQGESLVGDRQFWVSRPYDWKKLLVAKAFFVLVFVNLPLFALDVFLLAKAGFPPASYLPGLLWMQWMWTLLLFLTVAGLATVTATIAQMLLAILVVVLYMIGTAALSSVIPNSSFSAGGDSISSILLVVAVLAVILLQYSRRKTALSRWLIVGLGATLTLQMVATPYRRLIAREYPLSAAGESPITWSLLPGHAPDPENVAATGDQVAVHLPFSLSGLPKDAILQLNGVILTLTDNHGAQWDSGWEARGMLLFPDQKTTGIDLSLKKSVFDRMSSSPVKAHLLLAFTLFHDKNQRPFVTPRGEFPLPDLGLCSVRTGYWPRVSCKVPLRRPTFFLITSEMATGTCPLRTGDTRPAPGEMARGSIQGGDSGPAEIGISPVKTVDLYLSHREDSAGGTNTGICPGTPLVLSNPEAVSRGRIELQFDNLSLADYQRASGLGSLIFKR